MTNRVRLFKKAFYFIFFGTLLIVPLCAAAQGNFSISASPSSFTVQQGGQGNSIITTAVSGGFNSPITFSGLAGSRKFQITFQFNPSTIPAPGSGSSVLTVTVGPSMKPGTYPLVVVGNGGGVQRSTNLSLTVTAHQQPNFTIAANPSSITISQGNQNTSNITTTISGGFNSSISLSDSGAPSGSTVSFSPNPIPAPGAGNSIMTIVVDASTPTGSYPITVTGNGGGTQQSTTVTLTVTTQTGEPVPTPPQVYIDTTWSPPTGTMWHANSNSTLQLALNSAQPGDTIVMDNSVVYTANFELPAKSNPNHQWIYIESSSLSSLPPPGSRVGVSDAPNMAKVVTPNVAAAFSIDPGANYYRLIGLELTTNSNQGGNQNNNPPTNNFTWCLVCGPTGIGVTLPDSITIDRSYIHGTPSQDVGEGVEANGTNFAVIDSYISDIHLATFDSQAILAYWTPGPLKIVDNYLSATTEDVMLGGAGDYNNPYVPSDIEIRRNHFFKPLSWDSCGALGTVPPGALLLNGTQCPANPNNQWIEKNNLEFKSARRVVVTGNIMENTWVSGQTGSSVLFTIRTTQSGNVAVVDDILLQSNILTNVDSGFSTLEEDNLCGAQYGYPNCTNPGESRRIWIDNNLVLVNPGLDTYQHAGIKIDGGNATQPGLTDYIFQHNTVLMNDDSKLWNSLYFELPAGFGCSPPTSPTHNLWVLDNVMTRQPSGDCGFQGTMALNVYMSDPAPVDPRFYGNVMYVPHGDTVQTWPGSSNDSTTTPFTYVDTGSGDYQLLTPDWTTTTDGNISGIDWTELQQAMQP